MRYNHLAYNRGMDNSILIESQVIFLDKIYVDYTKSVAMESNVVLAEKVNFRSETNRAIRKSLALEDNLKKDFEVTVILGGDPVFFDRIEFASVVGKEMSIQFEPSESVSVSALFGKDMNISEVFEGLFESIIDLSKLLHTSLLYVDNLQLISSAKTLSEDVTILSVELQPGGILEIDSEFFTVDLNGVNVFDKYSGEWVYLSKNLADVVITASGDGLQAEVLYRERYL